MSSVYLLFATFYLLSLEPDIKLSGYVRNEKTGLPLASVSVFLEGTGYGTYTDESGYYFLGGVPEGKYILAIRMIGFESIRRGIEVKVDKTERVDFYLSPSPIEMEEVLVYAHPLDVTIITREEIKKANQDNIGGILNALPGISVRSTGTSELVSIRGCDPNKVIVMLDGVPMNNEGEGTFDISSVPSEMVERIEIAKGGSILQGKDAIGGVINIVTEPRKERRNLEMGFGSFNTLNCRTTLSPFFYFQLSKRDDFTYRNSSSKEIRRENSHLSSYNIFSKIPCKLKKLNTIFRFHFFAREMGMPGAVEQPTPGAKSTEKKAVFQGEINLFSLSSKTYITGDFFSYSDSLSWAKMDTYHRNITYGQTLEGEKKIYGNNISYGCSYKRATLLLEDRIRPKSNLNKKRNEGSVWLKDEFPFGLYTRGIIVSCLKYHMAEGISPLVTPKLGIVVLRGERYIFGFSINWNKGYRIPSFHELFWVPDVFAMGNPDLLPERGTNFEYGVNIAIPLYGMLRGDVTFFYNDIKDIIVWRRRLYDKYSPENVSQAKIYGREEKISWESPHLECEVNHTYLDARNYGEEYYGKFLVLRPGHRVNIKMGLKFWKIHSNIEWRWTDKRYIREANTKFLPPYHTIDANAEMKLSLFEKEGEIRLEVCNLANKSYEILERYPMPQRSWIVSFNVYF